MFHKVIELDAELGNLCFCLQLISSVLGSTLEELWQKCLGGSEDNEAWDIRVITDTDKEFIVAGYVNSNDLDVIGSNENADF
ncbi:MAG: hypothetical protein WHT65_08170 [Pseudothermotoga sp.]